MGEPEPRARRKCSLKEIQPSTSIERDGEQSKEGTPKQRRSIRSRSSTQDALPMENDDQERAAPKPRAKVWDAKCKQKKIKVGAVVGRRTCEEIIDDTDFRFKIEVIAEYRLMGDAQLKWDATMSKNGLHKFKIGDIQYKVLDAESNNCYWLFNKEEMFHCTPLIEEFEEKFAVEHVEWQRKIAQDKEHQEALRIENMKRRAKPVKQELSVSDSDDDVNTVETEAEKEEKERLQREQERDMRFGTPEEESEYFGKPRKAFLDQIAFELFQEFDQKLWETGKKTGSKLSPDELRAYYKREWRAIFTKKARAEVERRKGIITRRRALDRDAKRLEEAMARRSNSF